MKISKFLPGLLLPFLIFVFMGNFCPTDEPPADCDRSTPHSKQLFKLDEHSPKSQVYKTGLAEARCNATFYIVFGWQDAERFEYESTRSPMENRFADLQLKLGETTWNTTFSSIHAVTRKGKSPYDGSEGYVWLIVKKVGPIAESGLTQFFVEIEHDILEEQFNFFVDVTIEYSGGFQ